MKLAAVTPVYNEEHLIRGCINSLKPFVDRHVVLVSEAPYFGESFPPDRTAEVSEELGADVIKGNWSLDHHQRNIGLALCSDCDWVLTFDSDEMMEASELEKFIHCLETTNAQAIVCDPVIYWKTTDYRLHTISGFQPIIAVRPDVRFWHIRNVTSSFQVSDCIMHHLSWCAPKDIYKKVTTYAHAKEIDGKKWYREHYENWKLGDKVILTNGEQFDAIYNPLPGELRNLLKW